MKEELTRFERERERELRSLLFLYYSGLAWSANYVKIKNWIMMTSILCHYHLLVVEIIDSIRFDSNSTSINKHVPSIMLQFFFFCFPSSLFNRWYVDRYITNANGTKCLLLSSSSSTRNSLAFGDQHARHSAPHFLFLSLFSNQYRRSKQQAIKLPNLINSMSVI